MAARPKSRAKLIAAPPSRLPSQSKLSEHRLAAVRPAGLKPAARDQPTTYPEAILPKISLANHYNFVMIRGFYEKNVLSLWTWPGLAHPADGMRMFNISGH